MHFNGKVNLVRGRLMQVEVPEGSMHRIWGSLCSMCLVFSSQAPGTAAKTLTLAVKPIIPESLTTRRISDELLRAAKLLPDGRWEELCMQKLKMSFENAEVLDHWVQALMEKPCETALPDHLQSGGMLRARADAVSSAFNGADSAPDDNLLPRGEPIFSQDEFDLHTETTYDGLRTKTRNFTKHRLWVFFDELADRITTLAPRPDYNLRDSCTEFSAVPNSLLPQWNPCQNRCRNGINCQFCHLPHERRSRGRGCRGHGTSKLTEAQDVKDAILPGLMRPPPGLVPPVPHGLPHAPPGLDSPKGFGRMTLAAYSQPPTPQGGPLAPTRMAMSLPSTPSGAIPGRCLTRTAPPAPPLLPPSGPPRGLPQDDDKAPPPPENSPGGLCQAPTLTPTALAAPGTLLTAAAQAAEAAGVINKFASTPSLNRGPLLSTQPPSQPPTPQAGQDDLQKRSLN
eukprot:s2010_g6.t1